MRKILLSLLILSAALTASAQSFTFNHGPYLQDPAEDGMSVFFTTSDRAFSWVEVRKDDGTDLGRFATCRDGLLDAYTTTHAIRIDGLQPATTYSYRLVSKQMTSFKPYSITYGDSIATPWYSFRTLDPKARRVTFLVVNDGHNDAGKLRTLLQAFPLDSVDMVFYNGDMISYYDNPATPYDGFLDVSTELFAKHKPFVYVRGNHETRGSLARHYHTLVGTSGDRFYRTLRVGNTAFVLFDTGEDKPDDTPVYGGINDFDGYRTQQAEWFRTQVMKDRVFRRARHKIVLMHIPPVVTPGIPAGEEHGNVQLHRELAPLFSKAGIDLTLCGHTHHHYHYAAGEQGSQFPVYINDNHSALLVTVADDGITVRCINDKGEEQPTQHYGKEE